MFDVLKSHLGLDWICCSMKTIVVLRRLRSQHICWSVVLLIITHAAILLILLTGSVSITTWKLSSPIWCFNDHFYHFHPALDSQLHWLHFYAIAFLPSVNVFLLSVAASQIAFDPVKCCTYPRPRGTPLKVTHMIALYALHAVKILVSIHKVE